MTPLLHILALWRGRTTLLLAGLVLSLLALAAGVALVALSGATIAALTGSLLAIAVWLRALGPARIVLRHAERLVTHDATFRALADLRVWFFRGLAAQAAGGLGFRRSGDVLSRLVGDVEALDGLYLRILLPLAGALLLIPATAIAAGRVTAASGLAVLLLFTVAATLLPALAARLRIAALDTLAGLREVRAFGAESRMMARIADSEAGLLTAQRRLARQTAWANAAALLCGQAALLAALLGAGAAPATSVAACFLIVAAFEPLAGLPRAGVAAGSAAAAAARVLEVGRPAGTAPLPAPAKPADDNPTLDNSGLRFAGVRFAWSPDRPPVFEGLTLEIPSGARIAVLGPSGAGKSTLAALALKIVTPQSGRLLLGSTDMADLAADAVQRRIAWLGQTTHLFDDSIRANLALGRPDATDRELWDALDRAAIGDVVRALPDRLETWLGEGGARLSGGQGRRIALARTLLRQAPILILDEPCAGLDAETERQFLTTLFAETAGRTVILIAHRLTGAERLDRIWRLSSGHAVAAAA